MGRGFDLRTGRRYRASTIATASELPLGSLVVGGGQPIDFYRVELSAGDQIDIDYGMLSQPNCGYLYLFDPTVTDFNLAKQRPCQASTWDLASSPWR